jgi:hypothetical protein
MNAPSILRRPCHLAWDGLEPVSGGGVVFSKLSKLLNQENALSAPCYALISALRRRALAGRRNTAERRNPSLSHYRLLSPSHHAGKR